MSAGRKGFLAGAAVGIIAILVLMYFQTESTVLLLIFWPTSVLGFGYQGGSPWTIGLLLGVLEFGGNALIYGFVGFVIGVAVENTWKRTAKD
jgi:hypothetical protein